MLPILAAAANFMTGAELLKACEAGSPQCAAYIQGAADEANFSEWQAGNPPMICLVPGTKMEPIREAVLGWLYSNPKLRGGPAAPQVKLALAEAMPCSVLDQAQIMNERKR